MRLRVVSDDGTRLVVAHERRAGAIGPGVGPVRNLQMASTGADICISFWDGSNPYTRNTIEQAEDHERSRSRW